MDTFDKIHAEIKSCHYSAHACTGNTQNGVCQGQHHSAATNVTMIKMLRRINVNADFSTATLYLTAIRRAVAEGDYDTVSKLKVEMGATMEELKTLYHDYKQNIID